MRELCCSDGVPDNLINIDFVLFISHAMNKYQNKSKSN